MTQAQEPAEETNSNLSERMSNTDHLLWLADRNPDLRSTVVGVAIFTGVPSKEALRARIAHVSQVVPRLRQRVVANPVSIAPPRWELDPQFNLDNHLRWAPAAAEPRTMRTVLDMASAKALEPFPSNQPLWEIIAVDNISDDSMVDGQFVLIQKLHHALADGLSALQIQLEMFDFEANATPREAPEPNQDYVVPMGQLERMGNAVSWDLRRRANAITSGIQGAEQVRQGPLKSGRKAAQLAASASRIGKLPGNPLSPLMTGRSDERRFDMLTVSLSQSKAAGKAAGTRLNAVFLAGIAHGLHSYHAANDAPVGQVRIGIPISTRTSNETGNQIAGARFVLPLQGPSVPEHLRTIDALVALQVNEPALDLLSAVSGQMSRLPAPAAVRLLRRVMEGTDVQASNVPGSPLPMYLLGHQMTAQFPFGPTTTSAANITLLSYKDSLNIAVATNVAAIPDPQVFLQHLEDGFAAVLA